MLGSRGPRHGHTAVGAGRVPAPARTPAARSRPTESELLRLQRVAGNRAVVRAAAAPQRRGGEPVIQRTTAADIKSAGILWYAKVWQQKDNAADRASIIENFNKMIAGTGFTVGRGYKDYDPVVRPARKYTVIAAELDKNAAANAATFAAFLANAVTLESLSKPLAELALITCFAEMGRGYKTSVLESLEKWVGDIAAGTAKWSDVKKEFDPALTYKEDAAKNWGE